MHELFHYDIKSLYIYDSLKLKTEFKNYSCMCVYYLERGEI